MERLLRPLVGRKVLVYLDDVLIFEATVDVLLETLEKVIGPLAKSNLKCKPLKCSFIAVIIHYFDNVVSNASISPEQNKLDRIQQWPLPTTC